MEIELLNKYDEEMDMGINGKSDIEKNISNTKLKKVMVDMFLIIIAVSVAGACFYTYQKTHKKRTEEVVTPGLSNSVFDSQNNEYESESGMTNTYYLYNGHYAYDMSNAKSAVVGNTTFYEVSEFATVGVTSINADSGQPDEILNKDINDGFGIHSNISSNAQEKGYRNGWDVSYMKWGGTDSNYKYKGVSYVAKCDEGVFVVSAFSSRYNYSDIVSICLKVYDSVRVSDEWKANNEVETSEMFVSETAAENGEE